MLIKYFIVPHVLTDFVKIRRFIKFKYYYNDYVAVFVQRAFFGSTGRQVKSNERLEKLMAKKTGTNRNICARFNKNI